MKYTWSRAEEEFRSKQKHNNVTPDTEKIATIVVENSPSLGMLTALRFMEWAVDNPEGVVSLPTGKTPEYFIHWCTFFLSQWSSSRAQEILLRHGITQKKPPSLKGLHFVQIDEFYPINIEQKNSFYYYVHRFYLKEWGLNTKNALLINPNKIGLHEGETLEMIWPQYHVDLSLRERNARNFIEERQQRVLFEVDQFCNDYEARIRDMGGIGFFLGGIGPDGHIGFNVRGSSHYSTTRLCATNYETQAAAAVDLGGIEIARERLVITIGLSTIVYNPDCIAIIIAAGEAKAPIVNHAITAPTSNEVPASALRALENARFYITEGAAKHLEERNHLLRQHDPVRLRQDGARIITELALKCKKRLADLSNEDLRRSNSAALLAESLGKEMNSFVKKLADTYQKRILEALTLPSREVFLHTAPHHDDIMLGYIPYLARLIRDQSNTHYFNYLTSGFTSVTNKNLLAHVKIAQGFIAAHEIFDPLEKTNYFDYKNITFRNRDVLEHLDGIAARDSAQANFGTARRFLRNLNEFRNARTKAEFAHELESISNYLQKSYPGMKDTEEIQKLKGSIREWEADLLWGFFGFDSKSVIHSRLGFYKGDIFTEQPQHERDIVPIINILHQLRPTIISVALDPEGSGPDTHYKVLQAISEALKAYQKESERDDIEIWGYRNVWYRYQPFEANTFIPVSLMSMAVMQHAFINSFLSQADASFPSFEFDGPFSMLAQKVQVEQYLQLFTLLGRAFFYQNNDSRIRSTRGMIFFKKMNMNEFYEYSATMKKYIA